MKDLLGKLLHIRIDSVVYVDVNRCSRCEGPVSYNNGIYFCRCCLDTTFVSSDGFYEITFEILETGEHRTVEWKDKEI